VRPRKPVSALIVIAGVLSALAIGAGTVWFVRNRLQQPPEIVVIGPPAPAQTGVPAPNVYAPPHPDAKPHLQTQPFAAGADVDPHADDPDWIDLQVAHDQPNQATALLKYEDYRRRNPGKNTALLDQYQQEAMDHLWWLRIVQLFHRSARLSDEIDAKTKEINEEGNADYQRKLMNDRDALQSDLQSTTNTLRGEMGYTEDDPPNIADDAALKLVRTSRDATKYAAWSSNLAQYIRYHAGTTPWGDEDR
jgi:hypothetical protein